MLHRKRGKVEKSGPHVEVWDCRGVLGDVARSSRLPELPDSYCYNQFRRISRTCVLDLHCREMDSCVQPLGGGIVSVDRSPFILFCRVEEKLSYPILERLDCTCMRGCAGNSPGRTQDARNEGVRFGRDPKCVRGTTVISRTEMVCAEDSTYISTDHMKPGHATAKSVAGSLLFGSPLGCVRGVPAQDTTWIMLAGFWFYGCFVCWIVMSSSVDFLAVDQVAADVADSTPLPGMFLGLAMDRLYDLVDDIPDVMGLLALRPSAAVSKVMSVPDSRCVRAVTPDDHVSIGFHEILIHDLADEEWPLVTMSALGFLRLDWPKKLFLFMSRYQFDLDQRRKECREQYGSTQSGACTTCGKYIKINLGKQVA